MVELTTKSGRRWPRIATLKNGAKVALRQAQPQDAVGLLHFRNRAFAEAKEFLVTQPDEYRQSIEDMIRIIGHYLNQPNTLMLLAADAAATSEIVGEITFSGQLKRRNRHVGEFGMTARKKYWNTGIGYLLLSELMSWATDHSFVSKVTCEVFETNPRAIALYEKCGFTVEGKLRGQYRRADGGGYIDSYLMACWVKNGPDR